MMFLTAWCVDVSREPLAGAARWEALGTALKASEIRPLHERLEPRLQAAGGESGPACTPSGQRPPGSSS
jgi:hypothetical protein